MARVALTVDKATEGGTALTAEANGDATNGHYIANNDGKVYIIARNSGAGARTVTVKTPRQVGSLDVAENINSIAAGATEIMGPFPQQTYNQNTAGVEDQLHIDVEHAEVKLRAIRVA